MHKSNAENAWTKYPAFNEPTIRSFTDVVLFYFTITACPDGWVYGSTKCFLIKNSPLNFDWTIASDFCNGLDAVIMGNGETVEPSLIFVESVEEWDLLKPHVSAPVLMNCIFGDTLICYTDREGTTSDYRSKFKVVGLKMVCFYLTAKKGFICTCIRGGSKTQ